MHIECKPEAKLVVYFLLLIIWFAFQVSAERLDKWYTHSIVKRLNKPMKLILLFYKLCQKGDLPFMT